MMPFAYPYLFCIDSSQLKTVFYWKTTYRESYNYISKKCGISPFIDEYDFTNEIRILTWDSHVLLSYILTYETRSKKSVLRIGKDIAVAS